jgi:hypothetical protein
MCETLLGRRYEKKYVKGDVSILGSFNKNMSQRGLGSNRPHGALSFWQFMKILKHLTKPFNLLP